MTKITPIKDATTPSHAATHEASKREDIAKIRAIAERYVDAARKGQSAIFASDVLPTMRVQGYLRGSFVDISVKEFFNLIDTSEPATNVKAEIEAINVIGTAANIRIDCEDWHGVHYSDFMNLLKIDGVWKVVGKVFEAHENR